jgi:nucleoside diphosphate kinase
METSFYIIKPHGLVFREQVRGMIEAGGLIIAENRNLILPSWALMIIYSDLPEKYRAAVFKQFASTSVEAGLVIGKDAIKILLQITGTELDPVDCARGTIRSTFGGQEPLIIDGVRCYTNIIHRSRNKIEAEKDIGVFRTL